MYSLFFDLDNTLLDHYTDGKVKQDVKKALHLLKKKGNHVVIVTGRNPKELRDLRALQGVDYSALIMMNGQLGMTFQKETLFAFPLEVKLKECLLAEYCRKEIALVYVTADAVFCNKRDAYMEECYRDIHTAFPPVKAYEGEEVFVFTACLPSCKQDDLKELGKEGNVSFWHRHGMDINAKEGNKALAVQRYLAMYGLPFRRSISFGDGGNDFGLLEAAHIGVAMGNALPELKAKADYITSPVYEEGVLEALYHFHLLEKEELAGVVLY